MNWFKSFWKSLTVPLAPTTESSVEPPASFTPRAQQVLALARNEAGRLGHNFVGTEHLLLGLMKLGQGTAVTILEKMGLDLETVRAEVQKQVGKGQNQTMSGTIPYTPRSKRVLILAVKEARSLNHVYVGTEHILLGLLIEGDGVAPRVLKHFGVDTEKTRLEILRELDPNCLPPAPDSNPSDLPKPQLGAIDPNKRYDVYCSDLNRQEVVYRNALFRGRIKLMSTRQHDFAAEFLELQQSNGQKVYLPLRSVSKFCEHGVQILGEPVPPK